MKFFKFEVFKTHLHKAIYFSVFSSLEVHLDDFACLPPWSIRPHRDVSSLYKVKQSPATDGDKAANRVLQKAAEAEAKKAAKAEAKATAKAAAKEAKAKGDKATAEQVPKKEPQKRKQVTIAEVIIPKQLPTNQRPHPQRLRAQQSSGRLTTPMCLRC